MSFMNPKKKTKETSQSTAVTTRTTPDFIETPVRGMAGEIDALGQRNPLDFFAGADPLQTKAASAASGLTTSPLWGEGAGLVRGSAMAGPSTGTASTAADGIGRYMSPYLKEVVDATAADYDYDAGKTLAQQDLSLTAAGGFQGSGSGIERAETRSGLTRGRASVLGGLREGAYRFAGQMADSDASRQQQMQMANMSAQEQALARMAGGGATLANIGQAQGAEDRASIATQASMGDIMRQIAADEKSAPIDLLKLRTQLLAGLPLGMFGGQTTDQKGSGTRTETTSDPFGSAFKIAQMAAMASDERLKRDIVHLYDRPDGLGVYLYRYLWSPLRYIGVMAQEVLKVRPEAVVTMPNGYLAVNYGAL